MSRKYKEQSGHRNILLSLSLLLLVFFTAALPVTHAQTTLPETSLYHLESADQYRTSQTVITLSGNTEYKIATHRWTSGNDKLVFMIHGYADSCVYPKPLQRWFLQSGFDVICMELPGHGLSSGESGEIDEMEDYQHITAEMFDRIDMSDYQQTAFYGHSTGNVGLMEMLLDGESHPFDTLILATPLVRTKHWHLSKFGKNVLGWMLPKMSRRDLIDEPEYLHLKASDPNYLHKVPMDFFRAVVRWNKRIRYDTRTSTEPVHVIFAGQDSVINTRFNRRFYEERFTRASFYEIKNSGHMLHYSNPEVRRSFFNLLQDILDGNTTAQEE